MPYSKADIELAWAAGFFDGEGCTTKHTYSKEKEKNMRLRVAQSGDNGNELLERFKAAVGGLGKIYGPYKIAKNQTKVRWVYQTTKIKEVPVILELLWPYLGSEKRQQATNIMQGE